MDSGQVIPSVAGAETPAACPGSQPWSLFVWLGRLWRRRSRCIYFMVILYISHHFLCNYHVFIYVYIYIISYIYIIYCFCVSFLRKRHRTCNELPWSCRAPLTRTPKKCGSVWQLWHVLINSWRGEVICSWGIWRSWSFGLVWCGDLTKSFWTAGVHQ